MHARNQKDSRRISHTERKSKERRRREKNMKNNVQLPTSTRPTGRKCQARAFCFSTAPLAVWVINNRTLQPRLRTANALSFLESGMRLISLDERQQEGKSAMPRLELAIAPLQCRRLFKREQMLKVDGIFPFFILFFM